jgi:hypothetical protein
MAAAGTIPMNISRSSFPNCFVGIEKWFRRTARFNPAAVAERRRALRWPALSVSNQYDNRNGSVRFGHNNHVARKWKLGPVHTAYTPPVKGAKFISIMAELLEIEGMLEDDRLNEDDRRAARHSASPAECPRSRYLASSLSD